LTTEFPARRATAADIDPVTSIIALSFAEDPIWSRALALPDGSTEHHSAFWRLSIEGALRYPWTWVAGDGEAAAVWIPPGGTELSAEQEARLLDLVRETLGPASDDYLELLDRFSRRNRRPSRTTTSPCLARIPITAGAASECACSPARWR
jgi:hypothetical protein